MSDAHPPLPHFYLSFEQVRDSGLLSPARLKELEEEIDRRLTKPRNAWGAVIESARLADLSPYGEWIYPRMAHEGDNWNYAKNQILCAILTDAERELLKKHAFTAFCERKDHQAFEKAKKVPEEEWSEGVFFGDNYYEDTGVLHEYLEDNVEDEDYPVYVWAAQPRQVIQGLDAAGVTEGCLSDNGWEEMELDDLEGVPELEAALEAFTKANAKVVSYREDRSTAIILAPRVVEA